MLWAMLATMLAIWAVIAVPFVIVARRRRRPPDVRRRMSESKLQGQEYRLAFTLYSDDGRRAADVLEFRSGEAYLDEQEWVEGTTFKNRHSGRLVGPFASPADAEKFIVATAWFRGSHA